MANKKYVSLSKLQTFLDNLRDTFASFAHTHKVSDLTDYTVDTVLSSASSNPVQNKVLDAEFDAIATAMGALETAIDGKSDASHNHNDTYYTESEIDTKLSTVNTSITNITSGSVTVAKAEEANHATSADSADEATHAESADNATNANHAVSADNATNANHATSADSATIAASCTGNAATATKAEVAKAVRGTVKTGSPEIVAQAVGRLTKLAGVDTMQQNAIENGDEWAWIPSGDTCAFCLTLASRGWQRASRSAIKNGHAEHVHANCDCTYLVRKGGTNLTVEGYDPERLKQMYYATGEDTPRERINALRREFYAENKELINEQKREAYARNKELEDYWSE